MAATKIRLWNKAPALRILIPFTLGIVLQWYAQLPLIFLISAAGIFFTGAFIYQFLSLSEKFRFAAVNGILLNLLFIAAAAVLVWMKDIRHDKQWVGKHNQPQQIIHLRLEEPLIEKANSYKAWASVQQLYAGDKAIASTGKIIVYFKKDSSVHQLGYGTQLLISKSLQEIRNSGNPGSFDYKRYSLFQGITHQLYLTRNDFIVLPEKNETAYKKMLFQSRHAILSILKKYISGDEELGLAEALLIGYKDDLDKNLVQSYSNTGAVHVIAISGLHLGIIYWLLLLITTPLKLKKTAWIRLALIIAGLWGFSFLAGAQPSILRSAVMFTAIACATVLNRKTSIYNSLALSAFILLCFNPYWLWDVGFQLSYTAVLSIIVFFRPIYNRHYFSNKLIDAVWKLMAASLAAQILTLPVSIYHFHQFPFLFLLANLLAVPLSSIILIGEILLCLLHFIEPVAEFIARVVKWMIQLMNNFVQRLDNMPFAVGEGISITIVQAFLLYGIIAALSFWLLEKKPKALSVATLFCLAFIALRSSSLISATNQQKIIVYNVPKHPAIDLIKGRTYSFVGDTNLEQNDFLRNFHIQPSRIMHRMQQDKGLLHSNSFSFCNKNILIIDTSVQLYSLEKRQIIDVLILSKNPKIRISNLTQAFFIKQIVVDGSAPRWKARVWKKDCDSLHISCHDVSEKGAFVMNL